ncbi:DUF2460 domain-containing protein [Myxococcota bacterium]|nr:DUF2460 domain-containing protein [Myxococcota bacterium]
MQHQHVQAGVGPLVAVLLAACVDTGVTAQGTEPAEPVVVEELFEQAPQPKVDVLWVIDSTTSMAEEQAALAEAFDTFADALDELDLAWQAGVVTADVGSDQAGVLQGNPWIIHPDLDDPSAAFAQAADVGTDPQATQAGLGAAWLALSEPLRSQDNRGFRRADASLHVVVVSDGDDESQAVLGDDPAGAFLDFLEQEADNGLEASLSAVIGDVPDGCGSAQPGTTYAAVAQATGGAVGSICAASFAHVTAAIGKASISWPSTFPLQEAPAEGTVAAWIDDARVDAADFTVQLDPPAIAFASPPAAGATIRVRYELPQPEAQALAP